MISLIINSYLSLLLSVGTGSLLLFALGLYWIIKKNVSPSAIALETGCDAPDVSAISGEDVVATQLDLARAYIEADKKNLARHILETVIAEGDAVQQQEAQHLLSYT